MEDFLRQQINYFTAKFGWWFSYYIPSVKGKNNMMINILLFCIVVLFVLILFNPGMEDKKRFLIFFVIVIAAANLFILLYSSRDEHPPAATRNSYPGFTPYPSTSPFNPRTEESTKKLLRDTSEMLDSQSKGFTKRSSFLHEPSIAQRSSSITRRNIDYSRREEVSPYGRTAGYTANNQSLPNIAPSSVFQAFNQGQSANRSTLSSRNVRDVPIPQIFSGGGFRGGAGAGSQSPLNTSTRYNYHMDGNQRKASDYAYSSSPMRGTGNMRKPYSYMEGRSLIDEQFGGTSRETTMQLQNEKEAAEEQLVKLKIISQFHDWKKNCQRWFQARLIPKILDSNITNIKELNRIIGYFDKRLYEYEFILKLDQGRTAENIGQKPTSTIINMINIDELLNYETSFRTGGPLWPSTQLSASDIHRAHQDLIHLVQTRRQLEKYFEIPGFRPFEVRTHILERLFRLRGDFTGFVYNPDGSRRRLPTDTQILSHLFFTFLNIEAAAQTDDKEQIYRNFVFKSNTNTVPSNIGNEDVYFRQTSPDGYEPQYDIVSGKEIWKVYPGLENLFCAIVLFVWHIKTKKHGTLGFEESKTFKEFMQTVIP